MEHLRVTYVSYIASSPLRGFLKHHGIIILLRMALHQKHTAGCLYFAVNAVKTRYKSKLFEKQPGNAKLHVVLQTVLITMNNLLHILQHILRQISGNGKRLYQHFCWIPNSICVSIIQLNDCQGTLKKNCSPTQKQI